MTTKVFKEQCCYCFITPAHPGGLFICMNHRYAFCNEHVKLHKIRGCSRFLNSQRSNVILTVDDNDGLKNAKLTKLAIGVEGGFCETSKKTEVIDNWTLYPDLWNNETGCTIDNVETTAPDIKELIEAQSGYRQRELESLAGTWDGLALVRTKHWPLNQLVPAPVVSMCHTDWHCQEPGCDKSQNLWMNLTDGKIFCGRKYADGSGGNEHALSYYLKTKYPLVVNLGTICPESADVYSYDEDDMVLDPDLDEHLRHFGLDMLLMQKVEKTMLEKELDLNLTHEYSSIQEDGRALVPVYGPGNVGLHNLGNTCYMNSIVQALAQMPEVMKKIEELKILYAELSANVNPMEHFGVQIVKLFTALSDGKYSVQPDAKPLNPGDIKPPENGLRPIDFRFLTCGGHKDFSTKRQQDAEEYAHYMADLTRLHLTSRNFPFLDVTHLAYVEDNKGTNSHHKIQLIYDVFFPVNKLLTENETGNRPRLVLLDRMKEIIEHPETSIMGCVQYLCTFPAYLMIKVNRHGHNVKNRPCKFQYALEVDDVMDLGFLRATKTASQCIHNLEVSGHLDVKPASTVTPCRPKPDALAVSQLIEFGVDMDSAEKALLLTNNNVEAALNLYFEGGVDQTADEPSAVAAAPVVEPDRVIGPPAPPSDSPAERDILIERLRQNDNGHTRYELCGLVSHIGVSTDTGHYVYHCRRGENKWVLFNDEKVAQSQHPPKEDAYIYIFRRI